MDMMISKTKEEAKALADFALGNGWHKVDIIRLSDCFLVITYT